MLNCMLSFLFRVEFVIFGLLYRNLIKDGGKGLRMQKPLYISAKYIDIGKNVLIWKNARIEGISKYNDKVYTPKIILGSNVSIQQNIHLTCANYIRIGDNTAIASNVTITDINHEYRDITTAPEYQDINVEKVEIGDDCKIYNNVVILPGAIIGKHCVIGANSVVRKGEYPDYSIIVGSPARIVKTYNTQINKWI